MNTSRSWFALVNVMLLAVVLVATPACKKDKPPLNVDLADDAGSSSGSGFEDTSSTGLPNLDVDEILWQSATGLQSIRFDYNSYALRADAREALKRNADLIKQVPTALIQIEGHCDERGTQEYNLALGEKRALATREYLISIGVSGDRLTTISYGEEMPTAHGSSETAWAQNRRCEFSKAVGSGM